MLSPDGGVPGVPGSRHPVRVLVVDDHQVVASSLAVALDREPDLEVVGVATTLAAAFELATSAAPDVVLLDHRLPDGDGIAAIPELLARVPDLAVVVLTASTAEHVLVTAIEAGAAGFLTKARGLDEVISAVRAAASGGSVISPELLTRLLPRLRTGFSGDPGTDLTVREREVLGLVAQGLANAVIARTLGVSVHTVRNHVSNLSAKLGAHSKLEALSVAVREGLLPGE